MKYLQTGLFLFLLLFFSAAKSQQNYFIYIQTENKQPFYIKLDNKVYSSTGTGYVLLSKLKEGVYDMAIGFPKSEWPEQFIRCTIENKDVGYLLKNFGEKGWGLFNLQTLDVAMATGKEKKIIVKVETKSDEFSNLLSDVVNDPSIKQVEPVKETPKPPPLKEIKKEEPQVSTEAALTTNTDTISSGNAQVSSIIKRTLLNKNPEGTEMVYTATSNGITDTVTIFIPLIKTTAAQQQKNVPVAEPINTSEIIVAEKSVKESSNVNVDIPTPDVKVVPVKKEEKKEERKFIENNLPDTSTQAIKKPVAAKEIEITEIKKDTASTPVIQSEKKPAVIIQKSPMINSDCKNFATEDDFMKLRKKMVGQESDDEMIAVAKKIFKTKCFTVEQIKNLSVLFLKDAGKYAFFDMAYPFVSDSHNFSSLQSQLSETYYINRFQVMIRN